MSVEVGPAVAHEATDVRSVARGRGSYDREDKERRDVAEEACQAEKNGLPECRPLTSRGSPLALRREREAGREQQDEEDEARERGGHPRVLSRLAPTAAAGTPVAEAGSASLDSSEGSLTRGADADRPASC